ncbi:AraC family transcriptional regulator [Paenalcaligenes sp. Me131]|uniref:helix-turn-helix transcriptional regulator n=1 Tax=Paenalcaligenes sp. Me131 TaxID=3392636 RepID=UPI003D28ACBC
MSTAIKIFQGAFGRVSLLDMSKPLVTHAHHHCHALIKVSGVDSSFLVKGRSQPLTKDSVVLINAWEPHAYEHTPSGEGRCILLALYLETTWLSQVLQSLTVSGHPQFFPKPCAVLPPGARKLVNALAAEMLVSQEIAADILEGKIFDLFMATAENHSLLKDASQLLSSLRTQSMDPRIRRAVAKMRENLHYGDNFAELAAESALSRAHFFELFKRSTNLTPAVYANALRVEAAIAELCKPEIRIGDISYNVGFSAPGHFTRFFRQHLGITPGEYRRVVDLMDSGQYFDRL